MPASFVRSIRAKSLLIDFLLTAIALSHRDDPSSPAARCVGDDYQASREQAQRDQPRFSIIETIVFESDTWPGEYLFRILKAQAVFGEVTAILRLVPLV